MPTGFRVSGGFDSSRAIVETGTSWAVPAAEEPAVLFLRASTERHLVGIPVGIDSNWWRKFFQIQLVLVLGDCRGHQAENTNRNNSLNRWFDSIFLGNFRTSLKILIKN